MKVKTIKISGVIVPNDYKGVYEWLGIEATAPEDVEQALAEADGEELTVEINSGGGSVFAGSEIYTALKKYSGDMDTHVVGIAASAASVVAMAGDEVKIAPTGSLMIHNVSSNIYGDHRDMAHEAGVLKDLNKSVANAYRIKTGMDEKELLKMMDKETWLNAQDAVELGFADSVLFDDNLQLTASIGGGGLLPQAVVDLVRNELIKNKGDDETGTEPVNEAEVATAKLKLLRMKGVH